MVSPTICVIFEVHLCILIGDVIGVCSEAPVLRFFFSLYFNEHMLLAYLVIWNYQ